MRQYLLGIYQPEGGVPEPELLARVMAELAELRAELESTGAWVFGAGLHDPGSTTVLRPQGSGQVLVTDGPFTEGKEFLGGFTIVRAADLDAALAWGRRYALATGLPIEVRPFRGEAEPPRAAGREAAAGAAADAGTDAGAGD